MGGHNFISNKVKKEKKKVPWKHSKCMKEKKKKKKRMDVNHPNLMEYLYLEFFLINICSN